MERKKQYDEMWFYSLLHISKHVSVQRTFQVKIQTSHTGVQGDPTIWPTYLSLLSHVLFTSALLQSTQAAHCAYNILIQQSSNKQTFVQCPPYTWNFTENYKRKEQKSLLLSLHSWKFSGKDKQVHG